MKIIIRTTLLLGGANTVAMAEKVLWDPRTF